MLYIWEKISTFVVQYRDTHNLTPKTRKGKRTMKTRTSAALDNATQSIENLMNSVQRDTLMAVYEELNDKINCYLRILENGRMIMETLNEPRFNKLFEKRMRCWSFFAGLQAAQRLLISKL